MSTQQNDRELPFLLSVTETARLLGLSHRMAQKLIYKKEIRSIRLGARRMVPRSEVERLATLPETR